MHHPILDHCPAMSRSRNVVHARQDHTQRAGNEFRQTGTSCIVLCHIIHLAVVTFPQPFQQTRFGPRHLRARIGNILKTGFITSGFDRLGELGKIKSPDPGKSAADLWRFFLA